MTHDPQSLLDESTLDMLTELGQRRGKDLLGQLYGLFLTQGPEGFATMRRALADADADALQEIAHSLKGSYRSLGTPVLAELCLDLEQRAKEGRLDDECAGRVTELETAFESTRAALGAYLERRDDRR